MIDIENLTKEDITQLKAFFLEKRIISFSDILQPIEESFVKIDFNTETRSYELYMGVPKDWVHDMTMNDYVIELVSENDNGKLIKLLNSSDENAATFDELVLFAIDIAQRNNAILAKIREKESELKHMKDKMVEVQMALDREIEILKTIKNGEVPESTEEDDDAVGEDDNKISVTKADAEKFVELITNAKK